MQAESCYGPLFFRHRKKAGVVEHHVWEVLDHAGLLFNEPPDTSEVPFI